MLQLNRFVLAHLQLAVCSVMMYCNLVGMLNKISSLTKMKMQALVLPVVMIADLIAAGLQVGWRVLRRPAMPET